MELLLNKGELLDLGKDLRGLTVISLAGSCWLTQAGDSRDYILRGGRQVEITSRGQVLLCATESCRLRLSGAEMTAALAPTLATGVLQ